MRHRRIRTTLADDHSESPPWRYLRGPHRATHCHQDHSRTPAVHFLHGQGGGGCSHTASNLRGQDGDGRDWRGLCSQQSIRRDRSLLRLETRSVSCLGPRYVLWALTVSGPVKAIPVTIKVVGIPAVLREAFAVVTHAVKTSGVIPVTVEPISVLTPLIETVFVV